MAIMKRIFSVRLNLDDMAASLEFIEGDAALAEWLRGFRYGLRGATSKWSDGPGFDGFRIGSDCLGEAIEFQVAKSNGGKKSAKSRKQKTGTAQPHRTNFEDTSKTLQANFKDTSLKNDNSSNQSLIVNPVIEESKNRQTSEPPARDEMDILAPSESSEVADSDKWHCEKVSQYAKELIGAGCKIGANNWTTWKRLVADYSLNGVISAAKGIQATNRWPDSVEEALIASRGQMNPAQALNPKRVHRMTL